MVNTQKEQTTRREVVHPSENILKILSCNWKIHRREVPLWEEHKYKAVLCVTEYVL